MRPASEPVEPLDPDSPEGIAVAERLGRTFNDIQARIDADAAAVVRRAHQPKTRPA